MDQHTNAYDYQYTDPPREQSRGCGPFVIGCSIALLASVGLFSIGGIFVYRKVKTLASEGIAKAVDEGLRESGLPLEQQAVIKQRVDELADDFQSGELTYQEITEIFQRITESRSMIAGGAQLLIEKQVLERVELTDEQKTAANRLVQRLARGIVEERIELEDLEPVKDIVLIEKSEGEYVLRDDLGKEDVDKFLTAIAELVDEKEIPDEPYEVDLAAEIDRIIDEVNK